MDDVWWAALALLAHVQAVESRPWSMERLRTTKEKRSGLSIKKAVEQRADRGTGRERLSRFLKGRLAVDWMA
ncbi:hypothetical protein CLCR_05317 [Cladophialophora carrionii]|uniref:Uncharacterized protein n=1 Tax=Cladophialophora carrionii TaxID=86049 RepID=A0A1C1CK93_9EURO|nr:hypothetical protein CLCR_05317 [Cladophialophora carrionii]